MREIWKHIDKAEELATGYPDAAIAHALIAIAKSLADMNGRDVVRSVAEDMLNDR